MKKTNLLLLSLGLLASCSFCVTHAYAMGINHLLAQANSDSVDPDYAIELEQNTECSFITGNRVNIRSGPGTQHSVVTQLNRGDGVRALYQEGDWIKLAARVYGTIPNERFEPLDGWVYNQYINGCSEDQFERWRQ